MSKLVGFEFFKNRLFKKNNLIFHYVTNIENLYNFELQREIKKQTETKKALETLKRYFERPANGNEIMFNKIHKLGKFISFKNVEKQTKIKKIQLNLFFFLIKYLFN